MSTRDFLTLLANAGTTLDQAANAINVRGDTLLAMVKGYQPIPPYLLIGLSKFLGLDISEVTYAMPSIAGPNVDWRVLLNPQQLPFNPSTLSSPKGRIVSSVQIPVKTAAPAAPFFWEDGSDINTTLLLSSKDTIVVVIPSLTANRVWTFPASPPDGQVMIFFDRLGAYVTANGLGIHISMQGFAGTEHIYAEGADKGTSYTLPAALLGDGALEFVYRASDSTWNMS